MIITTTGLDPSSKRRRTPQSHRRLSRALFAGIPVDSLAGDLLADFAGETEAVDVRGDEMARLPSFNSGFFDLSSDLEAVPDRLTMTETLQAVGFADSDAESVGVDVAIWTRPPAKALDQIAWRRVFTWIVGADENLSNVSILDPPIDCDGCLAGTYGYDAGGVPGYGILRIAVAEDGAWQICDCWGNAADADRIEALAGWDNAPGR